MLRRFSTAIVAACLLAPGLLVGCSGGEHPQVAAGEGESAAPARDRSDDADGRGSSTTTSPRQTIERVSPPELDGLADAESGPSTTASPGSVVVPSTSGSSADPTGIYRGVLGGLGPDEPVVPAVVDPPPTRPGTLPLTGLPGEAPARPAAVVKVDNSSPARPQTGLNSADIVIEEEVEGGVTRFAAVFHSSAGPVGPVRSGRTTDLGILLGLGSPLLLYSGANEITNALLRQHEAIRTRESTRTSGYRRESSRKVPYNLYTDLDNHWGAVTGDAPPAQFAYRGAAAAPGGEPATAFTVAFDSNRVSWAWDGAAWLRSQSGRVHALADGVQVSAANVVVIETEQVDTGMTDTAGSTVPEFVFVGSGPATVFTGGARIAGTWTRPTLASVATLTTADGQVIELTPGRTWIELIEVGTGALR